MEKPDKYYEKELRKNIKVKADITNGMNVYNEMDLVLPKTDVKSTKKHLDKGNKNSLKELNEKEAKESETQLADRIETNNFQG